MPAALLAAALFSIDSIPVSGEHFGHRPVEQRRRIQTCGVDTALPREITGFAERQEVNHGSLPSQDRCRSRTLGTQGRWSASYQRCNAELITTVVGTADRTSLASSHGSLSGSLEMLALCCGNVTICEVCRALSHALDAGRPFTATMTTRGNGRTPPELAVLVVLRADVLSAAAHARSPCCPPDLP